MRISDWSSDVCSSDLVVLVTKHHDGVLLWPSDTPNPHKERWASARDLVGDLAGAVRERGMRFGTYYSGGLDRTFGGLPMTDLSALFAALPQTPEYPASADPPGRTLTPLDPQSANHRVG